MKYRLAQGVTLHIIPTQKYTTTRILVNFATQQSMTNSAPRNLLVNLLVNACQKYPNQTMVARHLANLYGAELDGYVVRMGLIHNLRLSLTIVNSDVVDSDLSHAAVDFLHQIIFHPLQQGAILSPHDWQQQQNNLLATLSSWDDDKQYLAVKNLLRLYFADDSVMQMPSVGTVDTVQRILPDDLMRTYQQMLNRNQIDIFVEGNVSAQHYLKLFQQWAFLDRNPQKLPSIFYQQAAYRQPLEKTDYQKIQQTRLDLAYRLPVYLMDKLYYPTVVMNGLLGASPYSMLFENVREKASLAYYASSVYRPFAGYLFIQSGINGRDRERTQQLIEKQVIALQQGKIDDQRFIQVKRNLVNAYLAERDNPNQLIDHSLVSTLAGITLAKNPVAEIKRVTPELVTKAARQLQLQAIYCLDRG